MMNRRLVLLLILFLPALLLSNEFAPLIDLAGYAPIVNNRLDVYKLDKGLNIHRQKPYLINNLEIKRKEEPNFEKQIVTIYTQVEGHDLYPPVPMSFDSYISSMQDHVFRKSFIKKIKDYSKTAQVTSSGLIGEFVLELPAAALPRSVQKVLGSSAGRLNLDGTQKVNLQVSSTKRKKVPIYETSNKSSFDIKMEQETNLHLSGTIGEKIQVNLKYNSKLDEELFDPNNVNIKYTGDEDEIVQLLEAGNITLSLSGSRYISYSTSSQGLFGITGKFKYGDLDVSVIASKEEGQKNTMSYVGQAQADSVTFRSKDYTARTMYYLADPYELYDIFSSHDIGVFPQGWVDNAIKTDGSGAWMIKNPNLLPKYGTVRLFIDDSNAANNTFSAPGDTIFFSPHEYYVPYYDELIEGTNFITDYDSGMITVLDAVTRRTTLAVSYERRDGTLVRSKGFNPSIDESESDIIYPFVIRRRNQEYDPNDEDNVWHYQMRNIYSMNKTNVKNEGFNLDIYTLDEANARNHNLPNDLSTGQFRTYLDYLRLDSTGDGIIDGNDATINLTAGLVILPFIEPFKPLGETILYQEENESINSLDTRFYLTIKGKIGREAIDLSSAGILKGSVRVKVNGIEQKENVDYLVDYDFGRITFLSAAGKDPDARIEIDYESRSMFDVASKTLAGVRADWQITDYAKLGGTAIYRSETVADKRPRIGNENIEMWMANIDGKIGFKPAFITRWIDALPLISTNAESEITLTGEIAYTIPNIYGDSTTKKKVSYIDDMESIIDSYPLGITFNAWVNGSKPYGTNLAKGRSNWYNPKNIRREQIEDPATLTDRERRETASVLAIRHWPSTLYMPGSGVQSWSGIMKYLGNQLDFSQKKYIELMVKLDRSEQNPPPNVILTVDLGDINEDFYTEYGGLNRLNTEDANMDGVLVFDEDIGLDGIKHGEPGHDPYDLAHANIDSLGDYPGINGTEGNGILDTEDLNGNGVLDQLDRYFSYSISLADTLGQNHDGWVLYRIPLNDPELYTIVNNSSSGIQPTLKKISYARIWLQSDSPARVYIADAQVVGNKWQDHHVRDEQGNILSEAELDAHNTSYMSGIVSNQKNSNHYTSPPGTVYIESKRESLESSLSIDINNLQSSNQVLLRQRMLEANNLLAYETIKYWIYPEVADNSMLEEVDVFFRIGADSLNYYQITKRVPVNRYQSKMDSKKWIELEFDLQDISSLKEKNPGATSDTLVIDNTTYFYRGRPTLTAIRELYFGVLNPLTHTQNSPLTGTMYFNDLRVTNPYQAIGVAQRLSLNTKFADLSYLDIDYESKSENFNPQIQRGRTNTYTQTRSFNILNKYFINRFFPRSWGLDLPLTLRRSYTAGQPRYRANSDLMVDNILDETERQRERTETLSYYAEFGYSMRNVPKSKILEYTLAKLTLSGNAEQRFSRTATTIDTTTTWRGTMSYNLNLPADKTSFRIGKNYRLGYFPNVFTNSFTINNTNPNSFVWELRDGEYGWYPRAYSNASYLFTSDNNITWPLTSDLNASARFNTKRDLMQKSYYGKYNLGRQTEYVQDLQLNYNPAFLPRVFNLSASLNARYTDLMKKYLENLSDGTQEEVFQSDGNTSRGIRANFSLMNSSMLSQWATKLKSRYGGKSPKGEHDDKTGFMSDEERKLFETEMLKQDEEEHRKQDESKERDRDEKRRQEEEDRRKQLEIDREERKKHGDLSDVEREKMKEAGILFDDFDEDQDEIDLYKKEKDEEKKEEEPENDKGKSKGKEPKDKPKSPQYPLYVHAIDYASKLKNINFAFQNAYSMTYSRKEDLPDFGFQLGVPHTMPRDYMDAIGNDNTMTVSSGLYLGRNFDSTMNFAHSFNTRRSSASQQNVQTTFPDVTLSFMNWEPWIKMDKYLRGGRLNTGFQYVTRASGNVDWDKPKQESITMAMSPLLGFSGNFFTKLNTNLSVGLSRTNNTTDMDSYEILKTSDSITLNSNMAYSLTAGKGFTVPFTNKKIHISNQLSSTLSVSFEKKKDVTKGRDNSLVDRDTMRLVITPGATYQFDQNIRGGLSSSFENSSDKKTADGSRIFSLGVWVEINL